MILYKPIADGKPEEQGKYVRAEALYKRALEIVENAFGENHPELGPHISSLALFYHARRKYDEAEILFRQAIKIYERAFGRVHPYVTTCLVNLAKVHVSQRKFASAQSYYRQSLAICEETLGKDHENVAAILENMAECCREMEKKDEAEKLEARANKIRAVHEMK